MFENIAGIHIEGGYFEKGYTFFPFEKDKKENLPRISVVYGKNGSGKTSLAQGFFEFVNGQNLYSLVNLIDNNKKVIDPDCVNKENLFIFDENYIRRKIQFVDDGLDSIVMLGEQVELDGQIKDLETRKKYFYLNLIQLCPNITVYMKIRKTLRHQNIIKILLIRIYVTIGL